MPRVDGVTREEWEKLYDPMHDAFQALFAWHMVNAASAEEVQARITMDMAITVVNLFVVNAPRIHPKDLRRECLTFIENMRLCIERDDLTQYCIARTPEGVKPTKMEDNQP